MERGAQGDQARDFSLWLNVLKDSEKTCVACKAGIKRVHYKFSDGRELLEDWKVSDHKARELLGRYWARKSVVGKQLQWDSEFGEDAHLQVLRSSHGQPARSQPLTIAENRANPTIVSRSTAGCYEWRIRNLTCPKENYNVSCEGQSYSLVVSTTNKKYYKKLRVSELERFGIPLRAENIVTHFANRTLVIQYKKPVELVKLEKRIWDEVISPLRQETSGSPGGCTQA